ncbi:MAG: hypothetical protein JOY84_04315, partial [Curvibacter sp.]|nr:hypothetical protein [Curvibacter sp.]
MAGAWQIAIGLLILGLFWGLFPNLARAQAQDRSLSLYIDAGDGKGCPADLQDRHGRASFTGFSHRLTLPLDLPAAGTTALMARCDSATQAFGAATQVPGATALPQNLPASEEGALSLSLPLSAIPGAGALRLVLAASGDYLAETSPGAADSIVLPLNGNPGLGASDPAAIPALGAWAALALAMLLAVFTWMSQGRRLTGPWRSTAWLLGLLLLPVLHTAPGWAQRAASTVEHAAQAFADPLLAQDALDDNLPGSPDLVALHGGQSGDQLRLTLRYRITNQAPRLQDWPEQALSLTVGQPWQRTLRAADPDDTTLTWRLQGASPAGFSLQSSGPQEAVARFTPTSTGRLEIQVRVSDARGAYDQRSLHLLVQDAEGGGAGELLPPRFVSTPPTQARLGQAWRYAIEAQDPNTPAQDILLSLKQGPAGMALVGRQLEWTPEQAGRHDVAVLASRAGGPSAEQHWVLEVLDADPAPPDEREASPWDAKSRMPRFSTQPVLLAQVGSLWRYQVRARDAQAQSLPVQSMALPSGMTLTGQAPDQWLAWTPEHTGLYQVELQAHDAQGLRSLQTFALAVLDDRALPPDPATVAPPLGEAGIAPFADGVAFLHEGPEAIQTGADPAVFDARSLAVLRGRVLDGSGRPLPGVRVRLAGQPRFGETRSREDGWFDLAVNGGGLLTLEYDKPGYLRSQRKVKPAWRDWTVVDDLVLLARSPHYSDIDLGPEAPDGLRLAWGPLSVDERGRRRPVMLFPAGVKASLKLPDGRQQTLNHLTLRATEYTVGPLGPAAMPGELPVSVGYTYAVDISVDEAEVQGARSVRFSEAVPVYVDNFIAAPVGTSVPAGWYDPQKAAWVGSDNGRVIEILSVDDGRARLRVSTDPGQARADELQALGITDSELQALASLYPAGSQLWRVPLQHLSAWDFNWPWGPPPDAIGPPDSPPPNPDDKPSCGQGGQPCACPGEGCDIHFEARALGQRLPLAGTPYSLYYRSDRVGAATTGSTALPLPVNRYQVEITADSWPASLTGITVNSDIAGRRHQVNLPAAQGWQARQKLSFEWDGRDAYGREVRQAAMANTLVQYHYQVIRYASPADFYRAFERINNWSSQANQGRSLMSLSSTDRQWVSPPQSSPEVQAAAAGGWALSPLSLYDAGQRTHYQAGGQTVVAGQWLPKSLMLKHVFGDEDIAVRGLLIAADGRMVVGRNQQIVALAIDPSGAATVLAGSGEEGAHAAEGAAIGMPLQQPLPVAWGPDGSLYFIESTDVFKQGLSVLSPEGRVRSVPLPARPGFVDYIRGVAVLPDRNVLVLYRYQSAPVLQIAASGEQHILAWPAEYGSPKLMQGDREGRVWFASDNALYALGEGGRIQRVLPTDEQPAPLQPIRLIPDEQGGLYWVDAAEALALHHLSPAGQSALIDPALDKSAYQDASAVDPEGLIYTLDRDGIGAYESGYPGFSGATSGLPSADGLQIQEFDRLGRPYRLRSALNGETLNRHHYNQAGYLVGISDAFGNTTHFERSADQRLQAVVSPDGLRTGLRFDPQGLLMELQEPSGAVHRLAYAEAPGLAGLLARYEAPNGSIDRFEYDSQRRLSRNLDGDGSGWTLSPPAGDGSVTATTAMGRQQSIRDVPRQYWWQGSDRIKTGFDGYEHRSHRTYLGTQEQHSADGFSSTETLVPDQRFGMASPTQALQLQWSPGNTVRQTTYRSSTPAPGSGAWGERISNWTERTYQNHEPPWQLDYNVSTSRVTRSSPAGRKMQALLDAWQRPTEVELPGQYRQQFLYDPRGRLLSLQTQDLADPAASAHRTQTQSYHPSGTPGAGQLASRTDALGRTTRWEYDAAHRLSRQIGPDGRRIDYRYDLAGRLRELNTPNGAGHRFDYTLSDRLSQYQAPALGGLDDASTYWVYNADRLLTRVQRPGAQVLQWQRDSAGRLQDLLDGPYSTHFEWGPEGRLQLAKTEAGHRVEQHYEDALLRSSLTQLGPWSLEQHYRYEGEGSASFLPRVQSLQLSLGDGPEQTIEFQHDLDGLLTGFGPLALQRDRATGWLSALSLGRIQSNQNYNGLGEMLQSRSSYAYSQSQLDARLRPLLKTGFQALGQALSDELTRQNSCSIPWPEPDDEGDSQLSRASAESQSVLSGVTPPSQRPAIPAAPSRRSSAMGRVTEVLAQSIGAGRLSPEKQTVADTESAALNFTPDPGQRLQSLDSGCGLGNSAMADEDLDTVLEQLAQGHFSLEPLYMADPYHPAPERCTVTARFEAEDPSQTYYPVIADWQAYFGPEATPTNARLSPVLQWQALGQRARVGILNAQNLPIDRTTDLSSSCDGQLEGLNFTTAPLQGACAVNFYSQGLYDDPPRNRHTLRVDDLTPGSLARLQLLSVPKGQPAVISLPTPPARQVISNCGNGSVRLLDIRPLADAPGALPGLDGWEFFELDAPTGDCQVQAWALPPEQNHTVSVQVGQGGHASPATQTVWAGRSATLEIWSDPGMKIDQLQSSCPLQDQGWGRYSTAPLQSDCQIDVSFRASQAWRPRDFCQADLEAFNRRWAELLESPLSAASRSSLKALLELTQTRYAQGAAGFIPTHYPDGSPIDPGLRPTQSYLSAAAQQRILALRQLLDAPAGPADLYQLQLHRN